MTEELVAFLRACLDEDEQVARTSAANDGPDWTDSGETVFASMSGFYVCDAANGDREHIARWDPARVLAEVDVKREMLSASNVVCSPRCTTEHTFSGSCSLRWMGPLHEQNGERWLVDDSGARHAPPPVITSWVLRLLALPYRDHPDYRSEWAPDA
jgi:hypothetical protein